MIASESDYDAVVVGASLAGCTAAALLGRSGARVALVERQPDPAAFKRICSHFIQSSALPTLERLGVLEPIVQAGGVRSRIRVWTRWGWIEPAPHSPLDAGVNLRRERLDPMLRELAARTPGVELRLGATVDGLITGSNGVEGVQTAERSGQRAQLRAKLVVGADGRDSRVAKLAAMRPRTKAHGRFAYAGYFEGPPPAGAPDTSLWFLDPDWVAAFPTDSGLTMYAAMLTKANLPDFRRDPELALRTAVQQLPDAPPIYASRLMSPVLGKIDMTNVRRGPVAPGLALVGDAALAADPLWGVGCGWAFQSGAWLADSVGGALRGEESLEGSLKRYRRRLRRKLALHTAVIDDYASGRRLNAGERFVLSAAARDSGVAECVEAIGTRNQSPVRFAARALPRALAVHARGSRALSWSERRPSVSTSPQ